MARLPSAFGPFFLNFRLTKRRYSGILTVEENMNPQPEPFIINVCTVGFILLVLYFAATTKKSHCLSNDLIDILYEVPPRQNIVVTKPVVRKTKNPKPSVVQKPKPVIAQPVKQEPKPEIKIQPKPKLTKNTFTPLHEDCMNALLSLGMKKKEAVSTVIDIFSKHDITCIEDFIKKAFVPNEYYRSST